MKTKDHKKELVAKTTDELVALEKSLRSQLLETRFKNFTNNLDDTNLVARTRTDIARVKTILAQRAKKSAESSAK